jgi:uracil-DNA glycosylase
MEKKLVGNQTIIVLNDKEHLTLKDILPFEPGLDMLFIAKTPTPISVNVGHYFQGRQGRMFWNKLKDYSILSVPFGEFEDDNLLENCYGITDIVKVPRGYGNEPTEQEYQAGLKRIIDLIHEHSPKVIVFVYKKVLDQILKLGFNNYTKSKYGFNPSMDKYFDSRVFVFPMPGTPCSRGEAHEAMSELKRILNK